MNDKDPREVARAAEIAADVKNWERLKAAGKALVEVADANLDKTEVPGDD